MALPVYASLRATRRFGRIALTALVIGLGGAALATFPLDNLAFAGNGNGNGGGKGGGNGGGHGDDGGHGGGKGNGGGGQGNGQGSHDGPGKSANAGRDNTDDRAGASSDDSSTDDATSDDDSMAPAKLGKLNGFFHASPNGLANAAPNSSIGRISHAFKDALSDFAAAGETPADPNDPNATPPSGPSVDDLGAILAGATNKQVTAAQVEAIVHRLAEQNPDDESLNDFADSLDAETAQDIADAANAAKPDGTADATGTVAATSETN